MPVLTVTDATFEAEVIQAPMPVLIVFNAEWAGPCRVFAPTLEAVEAQVGNQVRVCTFDIDTNPLVPIRVDLKGVPGLMLFKDGQRQGSMVGNLPEEAVIDFLERNACLN